MYQDLYINGKRFNCFEILTNPKLFHLDYIDCIFHQIYILDCSGLRYRLWDDLTLLGRAGEEGMSWLGVRYGMGMTS